MPSLLMKKYRKKILFYILFWFFEVTLIVIFRKKLPNFNVSLFGFINTVVLAFLVGYPLSIYFDKNYKNIVKIDKIFIFENNIKLWIKDVENDDKAINDWRKTFRCFVVANVIIFFTSVMLSITLSF